MKRIFTLWPTALVALAGFLPSSARANAPGIVAYQGIVTSNGTNFSGSGNFKFALINGVNGKSLWSNNGSSVNGSEPTARVTVPVTNGVFNVPLGDTAIAGMTDAIPASAFANDDVRLRVWFSAGELFFTQLEPDQRITSVGYAMMSANVAAGAIAANQLADGAVTGAKIADNSISSAAITDVLALRELTLETAAGLDRIELSGAGDSGVMRMNHGSIGRFMEMQGTAEGGQFKLFDKLGGLLTGQTTVELGSASTGGYARLYQDDNSAGVHINGQNGPLPGGMILVYRESGLGVVVQGQLGSGGGQVEVRDSASDPRVQLRGDNGTLRLLNQGAGTVTLKAIGDTGDLVALTRLGVASSVDASVHQASLGRDANGGLVRTRDENDATTALIGSGSQGGFMRLYRGGQSTITLDADSAGEGRITTQVLQITGGSDLSEQFDVRSAHEAPQPGMIVSIDPKHPGELAVSTHAYDRTVAGVMSGAGGVKPGMLMGQAGSKADGQHPVALTGRVYCLADASSGAIKPGDLITTSTTPGHGMKVTDHARAQGAIIGKAMTGLPSGKGLVLVLVSLQ
jgi:hypothetical protein